MGISHTDSVRPIVAAASLGLVGASSIVMGARSGGAPTVVEGTFTVACALLYLRRSAMSQVLARAAAWAVILPYPFTAWLLWTHGLPALPPTAILALPALAAISLVVAWPLLHTEHARATFAPIAMRSWFLGAATTAIGIGIAITTVAEGLAVVGLRGQALLFAALAASLIGSGVGVVRMRAWGVLAGTISAVLGVAVAYTNHAFFGWSPLFLAAPGAMTTAALIAARAAHVRQLGST